MKCVILDSFEDENTVEASVKRLFRGKGEEYSYFKLKDKRILPCRSCGACGFKSPGKCVINDDIHEIMREIATSSIIILLTPVRFGGYSSQLKKVIDRMMPIGMPLYTVKKGHLLHPMRYGDKALIGIGLAEKDLPSHRENFKLLVNNNALNMLFSYNKALIYKPSDDGAKIEKELATVLREVKLNE